MSEAIKNDLVVCIVNAGFSEDVMTAARAAGAKGGTIIRGRGTANPEAEEFFNISIQPDKEMILILVSSDIKDEVMKSIYRNEGLASEAAAFVFSLPVSRTTLKFDKEKEEEKPEKPE